MDPLGVSGRGRGGAVAKDVAVSGESTAMRRRRTMAVLSAVVVLMTVSACTGTADQSHGGDPSATSQATDAFSGGDSTVDSNTSSPNETEEPVTDPSGRPTETPITVVSFRPGIDVQPTPDPDELRAEWRESGVGEIAGVVLDRSGQPLEGCWIDRVGPGPDPEIGIITNAQGEFSLHRDQGQWAITAGCWFGDVSRTSVTHLVDIIAGETTELTIVVA
jgi:hypothetical protein